MSAWLRAGGAALLLGLPGSLVRWLSWARPRCARSLGGDQRGQSTVEYALLLGLISVPLALLILTGLEWLFQELVRRIVDDFTNGPS